MAELKHFVIYNGDKMLGSVACKIAGLSLPAYYTWISKSTKTAQETFDYLLAKRTKKMPGEFISDGKLPLHPYRTWPDDA
jgi:hypothetical protein